MSYNERNVHIRTSCGFTEPAYPRKLEPDIASHSLVPAFRQDAELSALTRGRGELIERNFSSTSDGGGTRGQPSYARMLR